jgi:TatA/E family protein of Tat protein translocase
MGSLGFPELLIIGVIALLIFGPKKLPELGKGLGTAIRDFKGAMQEGNAEKEESHEAENKAPKE